MHKSPLPVIYSLFRIPSSTTAVNLIAVFAGGLALQERARNTKNKMMNYFPCFRHLLVFYICVPKTLLFRHYNAVEFYQLW